jgi:hypothetical protein
MKTKRVLCPERLRHVPHRFSWIDQWLVREARCSLLAAGLIAFESPLYQVLSLEPTSSSEQPLARTGQTLPISAILRQMLKTGGAQQQPSPSP